MSDQPKVLENGARVLSYTEEAPAGNGFRRHGVALCEWPQSRDPFVTWQIYYDEEDGQWHAEIGHYFSSILDAGDDYEARGGK